MAESIGLLEEVHNPFPFLILLQVNWCYPNHDVIKFNCDAAVGGSFSCITVVAKNWRGEVV
jgi:hypothetical protein